MLERIEPLVDKLASEYPAWGHHKIWVMGFYEGWDLGSACDAIAASITTLPQQLRRSLTSDQGSEMAQHAQLRIDAGLDIYFCDPQSPWQRGTNENNNGLLRQYFPKGTGLTTHSRSDLDAVAEASSRVLLLEKL